VITADSLPVFSPHDGRMVSRKLSRAFAMFCRLDKGHPTNETGTTITSGKFFWEWVCRRLDPRRTTWIVAHDCGKVLQLVNLFPALESGMVSLDYPGATVPTELDPAVKDNQVGGLFVTADPPIIVGLRDRVGRRAVAIDVRNYVDCTMDDLAEWTGHPRIAMTDGPIGGHKAIERLAHDAEIVRRFLLSLLDIWDKHDLGMWRWTIGGLAMAAYRHRFMPIAPIAHDDAHVRKMERATYRGGEIIVPYVGRVPGTVHQLDVTSLYPHVMQSGLYPIKLVNHVQLAEFRAGPPPGDPIEQIAEVALDTGNRPFCLKTDTGTLRVHGRFTTFLAGQELDRAVTAGEVIGWRQLAVYKLGPLFRDYVTGLWPLRQRYLAEGNKIGAKLFKLLLVSLYGKFGQYGYQLLARPGKEAPRPWQSWSEPVPTTGKSRAFVSIGTKVFEEVKNDSNPHAAIAVAAFVTAAGRCYMDAMRQLADPATVYYQSCDSLIVSGTGLANLTRAGMVADNEIGKFKIQRTGSDCVIDGAHDYRIGGVRVAGWKSQSAIEVGQGRWVQVDTETLRLAARHQPETGVRVYDTDKIRTASNFVGTILPDGWTLPIKMDWGRDPLPRYHCSASAKDSPISSIRAAIADGATGGDCSTARTTALMP
jgi:hypothetical protein